MGWPRILCGAHAGSAPTFRTGWRAELSSPDTRGRSLGAYNAVQGFGSIAGPIVGGFVAYVGGYLAAFVVASAFVVAGIAMLTLVHAGEPVGAATETPA